MGTVLNEYQAYFQDLIFLECLKNSATQNKRTTINKDSLWVKTPFENVIDYKWMNIFTGMEYKTSKIAFFKGQVLENFRE